MKLHPRLYITQKASIEFSNFFLKLVKRYNLTYGEVIKILSSELSDYAKYIIREERHSNEPDKKGDEL